MKNHLITSLVIISALTGTALVSETSRTESVDVAYTIERSNGTINIRNADGFGVFFHSEAELADWLSREIQDEKWIMDLHEVAVYAHEKDANLSKTKEIRSSISRRTQTK